MHSALARQSIAKVAQCRQNCWMVTTARTAMRSSLLPQAPKIKPMLWVIENKFRVSVGGSINFEKYIDYSDVKPSPLVRRVSFLEGKHKVKLERHRDTVEQRYPLRDFENM